MRRQEFLKRAGKHHGSNKLLGLLVLAAVMTGWVTIELLLAPAGQVRLAILVLFLGVCFLCGRVVGRHSRRIAARLDLNCPHCGKCLVSHRHIVVASGRCAFCGRVVFSDE